MSEYPAGRPVTQSPERMAELLKQHLLPRDQVAALLRSLLDRIEVLEKRNYRYDAEIDAALLRIKADYDSANH